MPRKQKGESGSKDVKSSEKGEKPCNSKSPKNSRKKFNFSNKPSEKDESKQAEETEKVSEIATKMKEKNKKEKGRSKAGKVLPDAEKEDSVETEFNSTEQENLSASEGNNLTVPREENSEELLDYEDDPPSNESNSAQKMDDGEIVSSSGGSTVREKSSAASESDSSKIVSIQNTPRRKTKQIRKRKSTRDSSSSSSQSSSESESETDFEELAPKRKRSHKKKRHSQAKRRRKSRKSVKKTKGRKRKHCSSSSSSNSETGDEIRGLTEEKLKKMFSDYYNDRRAEEQQNLMKSIPDTSGQLHLSGRLNKLKLNNRSEMTIYSQNDPGSLGLLPENETNRSPPRGQVSSDSDNITKNLNSSDEIADTSPLTGQRILPPPPTIISDDIPLAEAMNRPEWSRAIEKA